MHCDDLLQGAPKYRATLWLASNAGDTQITYCDPSYQPHERANASYQSVDELPCCNRRFQPIVNIWLDPGFRGAQSERVVPPPKQLSGWCTDFVCEEGHLGNRAIEYGVVISILCRHTPFLLEMESYDSCILPFSSLQGFGSHDTRA